MEKLGLIKRDKDEIEFRNQYKQNVRIRFTNGFMEIRIEDYSKKNTRTSYGLIQEDFKELQDFLKEKLKESKRK